MRTVNATASRVMSVSVLLVMMACGGRGDDDQNSPDDTGAVTPPETPQREIPVRGGPIDPEIDMSGYVLPVPDMGEDPALPTMDAGGEIQTCCDVRFAIPDLDDDQEVIAVYLRGSSQPLDEEQGVALTLADGVWSVDACIPPSYSGTYYYEAVTLEQDGEGNDVEFTTRLINELAPSDESTGLLYNTWIQADSCEDAQVEVHALTGVAGE